jgi:hypothetical protein
MNSFEFRLGQRAAQRRNATGQEQAESPMSAEKLAEWRRGYGGNGKPRPIKSTAAVSAASSAVSVPSTCRTEKAATTESVPVVVAAAKAKPRTLFEIEAEPEKAGGTKPVKPKPPTPVPLDEVQHEVDLLVGIGIGLSEADDLVRKQQWTLDQMVCQWQHGNEAGLPQHVIGRVARYGQQRWRQKEAIQT